MIWVGLHSEAGPIGTIFCDEYAKPGKTTLDASGYLRMLQEQIVPQLKRRLSENFKSCCFQQDGAPIHTAAPVLQYLDSQFGERVISSKTPDLKWPAHSPDLSLTTSGC